MPPMNTAAARLRPHNPHDRATVDHLDAAAARRRSQAAASRRDERAACARAKHHQKTAKTHGRSRLAVAKLLAVCGGLCRQKIGSWRVRDTCVCVCVCVERIANLVFGAPTCVEPPPSDGNCAGAGPRLFVSLGGGALTDCSWRTFPFRADHGVIKAYGNTWRSSCSLNSASHAKERETS